MKQPKCKNCWDKGFSTVMESKQGMWDFHPSEAWQTAPRTYQKFCRCLKGKRMKTKAIKDGAKMEMFNLYLK